MNFYFFIGIKVLFKEQNPFTISRVHFSFCFYTTIEYPSKSVFLTFFKKILSRSKYYIQLAWTKSSLESNITHCTVYLLHVKITYTHLGMCYKIVNISKIYFTELTIQYYSP